LQVGGACKKTRYSKGGRSGLTSLRRPAIEPDIEIRRATTFRKTAVRGVGWLTAFQAISVAVSQIAAIVLATVLAPADFGLFGLAMIAIALVAIPGDLGMTVELVRRNDFATILPTALRLRWLIAACLALASIAIAPFFVVVFGSPPLLGLIIILAGIFPAAALGFGPRVSLTRTLDFRAIAVVDSLGRISGPLVSISLALSGLGFWSLAYGMLFSSWVTPLLLSLIHPVSYRGQFHRKTATSLVSLGKFVSVSTLFGFLVSTGDNLVAVAGFGLAALGLYTFAYSLAVTIPRNSAGMIETVIFPIFSKIADDLARVKVAYLNTIRFVAYFAFPLAAAFVVMSDPFVTLFLRPPWKPMVPIMQVLGFAGLSYAISVPASSVLLALGLAKRVTLALASAFVVLAGGLHFAWALHLSALVSASAVGAALTYAVFLQADLFTRLNVARHELLAWARSPAIASGVASLAPVFVFLTLPISFASFALAGFGGLGVYILVLEILSRGEFLRSLRELAAMLGKQDDADSLPQTYRK